jgi:hypothetical protein
MASGNTRNRNILLIATTLVVAAIITMIVVGGKLQGKKVTPSVTEMKLALQHVETGDIVELGTGNYQMVERRIGDGLLFKVPTCQGMPMPLDIDEAAHQATAVIKYDSTSVAWNNAAFVLMTGQHVAPRQQ